MNRHCKEGRVHLQTLLHCLQCVPFSAFYTLQVFWSTKWRNIFTYLLWTCYCKHTTPHHTTSNQTKPHHTTSHHTRLRHTTSQHITPHDTSLLVGMGKADPRPVGKHRTTGDPCQVGHTTPHHTMLQHTTPHYITHITPPHHSTSHQTTTAHHTILHQNTHDWFSVQSTWKQYARKILWEPEASDGG